MLKVIIGVLIGLVVGGALVFYFFIGVPKSASVPGRVDPAARAGRAARGNRRDRAP